MKLFDTHCHIQDERLVPCADKIIAAALEAGVARILCCGSSEKDWPSVRELCARHKGLSPAFGLHPWYITKRSSGWLEMLEAFLAETPDASVGEAGLDHALTNRNDSDQYEVLIAQLRLAIKLCRPASIHCRKAWDDLSKALEETGPFPRGFAIHSYSGSAELIRPLADKGAFFSFSGSVTWSGNKRARKAAAAVPLERLLVETDAPDLPPVINGAPLPASEPAHLVYVLREIAAIRNMKEQELASITWANSCRLFG